MLDIRSVSALYESRYYNSTYSLFDVRDWPWIFVKIHEPPTVSGTTGVSFFAMKKMKEDVKLVTF